MKEEKIAADVIEFLARHKHQPRLINITEGSSKETIPLGKAMLLIGRAEQVNVSIDSSEISRNHASITKLGDHYCLRDNGSTNGSFVNGKREKFKQLEHHDIIRFGGHSFLVDLGEELAVSEGEKGMGHANLPATHKNDKYTLTYNLEMKAVATAAGEGGAGTAAPLTIMTKGFSSKAAASEGPRKRTIVICPSCKMEVANPGYGICSLCGEKLK